jgi:hypothetical protein
VTIAIHSTDVFLPFKKKVTKKNSGQNVPESKSQKILQDKMFQRPEEEAMKGPSLCQFSSQGTSFLPHLVQLKDCVLCAEIFEEGLCPLAEGAVQP